MQIAGFLITMLISTFQVLQSQARLNSHWIVKLVEHKLSTYKSMITVNVPVVQYRITSKFLLHCLSWHEVIKPFYAPNFEKVGSILVSACASVCVSVSPFKKNSSQGFEILYMDSSSKNSLPVFFSCPNFLPLPSYAPLNG